MSNLVSALNGVKAKGFAEVSELGLSGMITLRGDAGAHAVGMALNISGKHYFLDPNSGLYECDGLNDIGGSLGLVGTHLLMNYAANYANATIEQFDGLQ